MHTTVKLTPFPQSLAFTAYHSTRLIPSKVTDLFLPFPEVGVTGPITQAVAVAVAVHSVH